MNLLKEMKKGISTLRLEGMNKVYNKKGEVDPTLIRATFSILDFSASGNRQIVPKQVGIDCLNTLVHKPLLCKYIETTDYDNPNDNFGDHDEKIIKLRDGSEYISTGTNAIGVCENAYIGVVTNDDGEEVDCIMGDFLLWLYRYPNEISLINDFWERGETLYTSCEHYYKTSKNDKNGNEIVDSLIFDGHCLLGSGIEPAYSSSKLRSFNSIWDKALNKAINSLNSKEESMEKNNVMFEMLKSKNAISTAGYRWRIYDALAKIMVAEEYNNMYLSDYDIYPEEKYFIYDTYTEENGYKLYKVTFTVGEDDVISVDYEGKQEVEYKFDLVEVNNVKQQLNQKEEELKSVNEKLSSLEVEVAEKNSKIVELNTSLNSKEEELKSINQNKTEVENKLNETNEVVISLNSKIGELENEISEMSPIVEAHQEQEYQKVVNSISDEYKEKFEKVNNVEAFDSEEVQDLIKKSVNKKDLSIVEECKAQLNQIVVDSIKSNINIEDTAPAKKSINSVVKGKENKNLVGDFVDEFEDMYGFKR